MNEPIDDSVNEWAKNESISESTNGLIDKQLNANGANKRAGRKNSANTDKKSSAARWMNIEAEIDVDIPTAINNGRLVKGYNRVDGEQEKT